MKLNETDTDTRCNYLLILEELVSKRANFCTQRKMAGFLEVSRRKIVDFENEKLLDFVLLIAYAGILGYSIDFNLIKDK
jgi:DNA-binding XRE family transcriptional regulator